jgi:hypothetical protein
MVDDAAIAPSSPVSLAGSGVTDFFESTRWGVAGWVGPAGAVGNRDGGTAAGWVLSA